MDIQHFISIGLCLYFYIGSIRIVTLSTINHHPPCFLTWKAKNDLDGHLSLDMTIPCLIQSFSIFTFMASIIQFRLILLTRLFERDMMCNLSGAISNMK